MNLEIKPMTVEAAHKFVSETMTKAVFYGEFTEEAAISRVELLWCSIVASIFKNPKEWGELQIKDFAYIEDRLNQAKNRIIEQKFARATIDTQKDKITIDGVQVHPTNVNFDVETEFVYQMGQNAKPHKKHKKLTIEWSEPCESNPVHTVAPPPPPPPPSHLISEVDLKTIQTEDVPQDPYRFQVPPSTFSSIQQMQSALGKDDYSYLNKLLKKAFAPWVGGYQPIAKEDQQTATPPKSR